MAALYSHTTRTTGTILTATIYNADHQNHIDNGIPAQLDDYSTNVTQMQLTTDPGEVGTESLAGNLAGELERLRFAIAEIKNRLNGGVTPQWYATASGAVSGTTGTFTGNVSGVAGTFSGAVSGTTGTFSGNVSGVAGTFTGAVSGTTGTFSGTLHTTAANVGATQLLQVTNSDNTNVASHAQLWAVSGGASGGDPKIVWDITGIVAWSAGLDNSDSDKFKIGTSSLVGTNTVLEISTSGAFTFSGSARILAAANTGLEVASTDGTTLRGIFFNTSDNQLTLGTITNHPLSLFTNNTERIVVDTAGRLYGKALHNNASSPTGTTNQYIASGTYTPTLTNVSNVAASTSNEAQWFRIGNVVTVMGKVSIDPTSTSTLTNLGVSIPIPSNLLTTSHLNGVATPGKQVTGPAYILADTTNDRATIEYFTGTDVTNQTWGYVFSYEVL